MFLICISIFIVYISVRPDFNSQDLSDNHINISRATHIATSLAVYYRTYGEVPEFDHDLSKKLIGDNARHINFIDIKYLPTNEIGQFVARDGKPFSYAKSNFIIYVYTNDKHLLIKMDIGSIKDKPTDEPTSQPKHGEDQRARK